MKGAMSMLLALGLALAPVTLIGCSASGEASAGADASYKCAMTSCGKSKTAKAGDPAPS